VNASWLLKKGCPTAFTKSSKKLSVSWLQIRDIHRYKQSELKAVQISTKLESTRLTALPIIACQTTISNYARSAATMKQYGTHNP